MDSGPRTATVPRSLEPALERALDGAIEIEFQPIVALDSRAVMGYEALVRGADGDALRTPDELFTAARSLGRVPEMDAACQAAALRTALDAGLGPPLTLFVNAEPEAARARIPDRYRETFAEAIRRGLRVVVEVTERSLLNDPAGLLNAMRRVRRAGWGTALDDVGADPRALALLPVIEPDVIKLDLELIQHWSDSQTAEIAHGVAAETERRGTAVLAEGIENEEQLGRAIALGATLGQGRLFGAPAPLEWIAPAPVRRIPLGARVHPGEPPTPFQLLNAVRDTRPVAKPLVLALARHLEEQAASMREQAVLISNFQHGGHLGPRVRARYSELSKRLALVGALGTDIGPAPAPGVRGAVVTGEDPLQSEWCTALVSPHFSGAIAARDLGDPGPDHRRRFDLAITHERGLVIDCARSLLARIAPLDGSGRA